MQGLSEEGRRIVADIATRHGVSSDAAAQLLAALSVGGGRQAQFNHPDLGGMGQWSQGGMIMVGDMFNNGLKAKVAALCEELVAVLQNSSVFVKAPAGSSGRWPSELGTPSSNGSQNDMHYAVFPGSQRLAIEQRGRITVYDTGDHRIGGVSQQQSGDQSLSFTSQLGRVSLSELKQVPDEAKGAEEKVPEEKVPEEKPAVPSPGSIAPDPVAPDPVASDPAVDRPDVQSPPPSSPSPTVAPSPKVSPQQAAAGGEDIFLLIERLADLRSRDILTAEEFTAKKTELLSRL